MRIRDYVKKGGRLPCGRDTRKSFRKHYDKVVGGGSSGRADRSSGTPTKAEVRVSQKSRPNPVFYYNPITDAMSTATTRYISQADYLSKREEMALKNATTGTAQVDYSQGVKTPSWLDRISRGYSPLGMTPSEYSAWNAQDQASNALIVARAKTEEDLYKKSWYESLGFGYSDEEKSFQRMLIRDTYSENIVDQGYSPQFAQDLFKETKENSISEGLGSGLKWGIPILLGIGAFMLLKK